MPQQQHQHQTPSNHRQPGGGGVAGSDDDDGSDGNNPLHGLPTSALRDMMHYVLGFENVTHTDFSSPFVRPGLEASYPLYVFQYAALAVLAIVGNVCVLSFIVRRRLYRDSTHAFLANLSVAYLVQLCLVTPFTLMLILVQNWIYGRFMCFFTPLLQVSLTNALREYRNTNDGRQMANDVVIYPNRICHCSIWNIWSGTINHNTHMCEIATGNHHSDPISLSKVMHYQSYLLCQYWFCMRDPASTDCFEMFGMLRAKCCCVLRVWTRTGFSNFVFNMHMHPQIFNTETAFVTSKANIHICTSAT